MANPRKCPYRCKNIADISHAGRVIALSQISLPWQRGSVGENVIGSIQWCSPENPSIGAKISQKSLTQAELKPTLSHLSLLWQRGLVGGKCNWQHSMAHPQKPRYRSKNLAKISYASQVIANFVPNFVAIATGVGRGKMQLAAFDGPSPKTPLYAQKSRKNLLCKPS